jgi:hypothetical protein
LRRRLSDGFATASAATRHFAFGALLLPIAIAVMALPQGSLGLGTVLIGISYSLVPR